MANTLRIKRRASTGSAGAPSSLENAELAYNEADNILYYGKGTGGAGGSATSIESIAGPGAYATLSTNQTISGDKTFTGTVDLSGATLSGNTTFSNNLTVTGDLTVNGTTTTVNSTTVSVDDKNIELGSTASPSDASADGGGITLKGTTDKTFNWVDATDSWTSSEDLDLSAGKHFSIDGTTVLNASSLGTGITGSSLTSLGTITTGTWSATDIAVAHGGTGASTAAGARTNLGLGTLATLNSVGAAQITDNSVGAAELNVSGNGSNTQFLRSDGDGSFSWVVPTDTQPNNATITISAGTGLSGGADFTTNQSSNETISLALDFSELTDMTGDISGSTEFILQNGSVESRKAASEIKISNFNNDAGYLTSVSTGNIVNGTIAEVDLNITNTPTAGAILTSGTNTNQFTWATEIDGGTF